MITLTEIYIQAKHPPAKRYNPSVYDYMAPEKKDTLKNPVNAILFVLIVSIQTWAIFEIFT
jgi:hypothetical protein